MDRLLYRDYFKQPIFHSYFSLLAQRKVCKKKGAPRLFDILGPSASLAGTLFPARAETRLSFCADALNLVC
ncbi:MAG: hypothetical protein SWH68_10615, partial [Thermodesulfobacteriota bacterium]|nr:hypothetical protein [Thermodesulfobacteriota bacterium]